MNLVDRSRVLAARRCKRERYLSYHHSGLGIQPAAVRTPLETGSAAHVGVGAAKAGASEDASVEAAKAAFTKELDESMVLSATHPEHYDYSVAEQLGLTEALVRVYYRRALPRLKAEWEILEVESEHNWPLDHQTTFMSRLDDLLRRRADGALAVGSLKTASSPDGKLDEGRLDLQGLTEPLAVGYSKWGPAPPALVKMEWLIKGAWKEEVRGSGLRFQDSFLVRPWMRLATIGGQSEFAWQYYTPCPGAEHSIVKADGKTWKCKGDSKTHGLGPSWKRVPIWEHMSMKEWIDRLEADPADPLSQCVYLPPPIERSLDEMLTAQRAIAYEEAQIRGRLDMLAAHGHSEEALDVLFPKDGAWSGACQNHFGDKCPFFGVCHGGRLDAIESMGFVPRVPNHPQELELK